MALLSASDKAEATTIAWYSSGCVLGKVPEWQPPIALGMACSPQPCKQPPLHGPPRAPAQMAVVCPRLGVWLALMCQHRQCFPTSKRMKSIGEGTGASCMLAAPFCCVVNAMPLEQAVYANLSVTPLRYCRYPQGTAIVTSAAAATSSHCMVSMSAAGQSPFSWSETRHCPYSVLQGFCALLLAAAGELCPLELSGREPCCLGRQQEGPWGTWDHAAGFA